MKARIGIILLIFVFSVAALAQFNSQTFLRNYDTPKGEILVGFVPYKTQVVLGEPLQVMFIVQNLGPTNFGFIYDWSHKGLPGHRQLNIAITDFNGKQLPNPYRNWGGSWVSTTPTLKPGQIFSNIVDLTDYCILDKPGIYTIDCSFKFGNSLNEPDKTEAAAGNTFTLTILERTPERVASVLDELIEKAKTSHGQNLNDTLALAATFGKNDAVSKIGQLAEKGPLELRIAALGALSSIPTDASLNIVLKELKDPDPQIRATAACSLGAMQNPHAVEAMLKAFPDEKSPTAEVLLSALGTTKSERAFPVITNAFDHGNIEMQRAAISALINYGGSNAVVVLQQHINTNSLQIRYEIVQALGDKFYQTIQPEWLYPILGERKQTDQWLGSLRLVQMYAGDKAVPALLSFLDFDVVWSYRNFWILYYAQYSPHAPHINYEYEPNSGGTPEQWTNNFQLLQALKPLAAQIQIPTLLPEPPPIPYLKTDPPIDFTPTFSEIENGGVRIRSGFLDLKQWLTSGYLPYDVPDSYSSVYQIASRFRALADNRKDHTDIQISPEQLQQLNELLHQFAVKLCDSDISDQRIGNFYNGLVLGSDYCPNDDDWDSLFRYYKEAPPGPLQQRAKADLIDSVRVFSQNYHSGTVEFAEKAQKIFTEAQLKQILE